VTPSGNVLPDPEAIQSFMAGKRVRSVQKIGPQSKNTDLASRCWRRWTCTCRARRGIMTGTIGRDHHCAEFDQGPRAETRSRDFKTTSTKWSVRRIARNRRCDPRGSTYSEQWSWSSDSWTCATGDCRTPTDLCATCALVNLFVIRKTLMATEA